MPSDTDVPMANPPVPDVPAPPGQPVVDDAELSAMAALAAAYRAVPPEGRKRVLHWFAAFAYGGSHAVITAYDAKNTILHFPTAEAV